MISKGLNFIIIMITYLLSYIIPKNKDIYVFGSIDGKRFSGNSKEVFLFYKKYYPEKKIYYVSENKYLKDVIGEKYFIYKYSFKTYFLMLRAKFLFIDSSVKYISLPYALIGKFNIILLWHGDGFKKIEFENPYFSKNQSFLGRWLLKMQYKNIKLGITGNYFNKNTFNKSFLVDTFKVLGLPRYNIFFQKNYKISNNIKLLKEAGYSKIIFYAPTWRIYDRYNFKPFSDSFYEKLNNFLEEKNYLLIIKPHYLSKIKNTDKSNIKIVGDSYDTQELLYISDILITDYSSIFIDFLVTKKPVIFYTYDFNEYTKKDKQLYLDYNNIIIKETNVTSEEDLINIINNIDEISRNQIYKDRYSKLFNMFHQYDNKHIIENIVKEINHISYIYTLIF